MLPNQIVVFIQGKLETTEHDLQYYYASIKLFIIIITIIL